MKYTIIEGHHDRSRERCRAINFALLLFDFKHTTGTRMAEHRHADRTLPFQCSCNDTYSRNPFCKQSLKNINYKNVVWDASETLGTKKKKYKKGRNETSSRRPASLQQPPPRKVYTHAQSHRHADTGTITHTQQSGNSRKAGTPTHSRRLKNLAGLNRKSTQRHYSILDNKLGWQGVHTHTSLKPTHQSRSAFSPFLS